MRTAGAGHGVDQTGDGAAAADVLAVASALRRTRPDLTGALADHLMESAWEGADRDLWLAAAGCAVHARTATGDGRDVTVAVLEALPGWGRSPLENPAADRLRVEVALVAVGAGEVAAGRALVAPVLERGCAADLRADALCVLARCAIESRPGEVEVALRAAEAEWATVGGPGAEAGAASVALVEALAHRRAGRAGAAADSCVSGLARLGCGDGVPPAGTPVGHLVAALAAEWVSAMSDLGRAAEARRAGAAFGPLLTGHIRPSRQLAHLRLTVARTVASDSTTDDIVTALRQAAQDAAASDTPGLEAVCRAAAGAVLQKAGRLHEALADLRLGAAAEQRDSGRTARLRAALAELSAAAPDVAAPDRADDRDRADRDRDDDRDRSGGDRHSVAGSSRSATAGSTDAAVGSTDPGDDGTVGVGGMGLSWLAGSRSSRSEVVATTGRADDERRAWVELWDGTTGDSPIGDDLLRNPGAAAEPSAAEADLRHEVPGRSSGPGAAGERRPELDDPWLSGRWSAGPAAGAVGGEPIASAGVRNPADGARESWLRAALADLDHTWASVSGQARVREPVSGGAEGCVVAVDVSRDGRRFAGPRAAAVVRAATARLADRLPTGARLRSDDADALAVVLPGWDRAAATAWMHRNLPGLLDGFAEVDLAGLQLRAAVHDTDGPVGAQLLQRLDHGSLRPRGSAPDVQEPSRNDAVPTRPGSATNGASGRRDARGQPDIAVSGTPVSGTAVSGTAVSSTAVSSTANLHTAAGGGSAVPADAEPAARAIPDRSPSAGGRTAPAIGLCPATGPASLIPEASRRPSAGGGAARSGAPEPAGPVPERVPAHAPVDDAPAGRHGAVEGTPFRVEGVRPGSGGRRHRRGPDDPTPQRSDPGSKPTDDPSDDPSDDPIDGLGIADLLAGALAAYRGI